MLALHIIEVNVFLNLAVIKRRAYKLLLVMSKRGDLVALRRSRLHGEGVRSVMTGLIKELVLEIRQARTRSVWNNVKKDF